MNLVQLFTTENQTLIFIIKILTTILEGFFFYKNTALLFNIKSSRKDKTLFVSFLVIVGAVINLIMLNYINVLVKDIINIISLLFALHYILKVPVKNSIFTLMVIYLEAFLSGGLAQIILINILKINLDILMSIPVYYFLVCVLSSLIWLFFIYVLQVILKYKKHLHSYILKISLKHIIIINSVLGIITLTLEAYLLAVYTDIISIELTIIIIFTLLIYFFISMYSIIRTHTLEKTKKDLENEKLYNKTLNLLHDNIRCFKHDFDNIVQSIGGYISVDDMKGLREYYKSLLNDCKLTNNLNVLNPETINNPSIYSLLTNKYYVATQKNIKMTFSVFTDLSKINFNIYEFTRMLGILLDNAIEAAEESEEKLIEIDFHSTPKKQLFIIKNTCKDLNIPTTKIFEKGYSTKERNSGIGLWKVHTILSKNTDADLFTTISDNMFSQQLEIFYKTNN